jgi:hypothetical protein
MIWKGKTLQAWLARAARQEAFRVSLQDVLVFGRFESYLWYRLRFFALSNGIRTILHVLELVLFFLFASQQAFIAAVYVRIGSVITSGAWWGGLEVLREGVRERVKCGRFKAIGTWVRRWLWGSLIFGGTVAAGAAVYVWIQFLRSDIDATDGYIGACLLSLALDLIVRPFHSGAYAVRRVYRPVWSMLLPEVLQTLVLLGLWPVLSLWSIPVGLFVRSLTSFAATVWFTWIVYRSLEINVFQRTRRNRSSRPIFASFARFLAPALASASASIGHFWVLALFFFGTDDPARWLELILYFVLTAPLIEANLAWSKVFYFDLVKLEDDLFRRYRRYLSRLLLRWSWTIGLLVWLPTALVFPWLFQGETKSLLVVTSLFFISRARLAAGQVIAFCERQYMLMICVTIGIGLSTWWGQFLDLDPRLYLLWVVGSMLAGTFFLPARAALRFPVGQIVPLPAMIALAPSLRGSGRWVLSHLETGRLAQGVSQLVHRLARESGPVGCLGCQWLLWWSGEDTKRSFEGTILDGLESRRLETKTDRSARKSLSTWRKRWPIGRLPRASSRQEIIDAFRSCFPDGVCVPAGNPAPEFLRNQLTWSERRSVLREAEAHLMGRIPHRSLSVDVSALIEGTEISVLFFVDRRKHPETRRRWRRWLRQAALANSLDALNPPGQRSVAPNPTSRVLKTLRSPFDWGYGERSRL